MAGKEEETASKRKRFPLQRGAEHRYANARQKLRGMGGPPVPGVFDQPDYFTGEELARIYDTHKDDPASLFMLAAMQVEGNLPRQPRGEEKKRKIEKKETLQFDEEEIEEMENLLESNANAPPSPPRQTEKGRFYFWDIQEKRDIDWGFNQHVSGRYKNWEYDDISPLEWSRFKNSNYHEAMEIMEEKKKEIQKKAEETRERRKRLMELLKSTKTGRLWVPKKKLQ